MYFVRSGYANLMLESGATSRAAGVDESDLSRAALAWGGVTYPGTVSRVGILHFNSATGAAVHPSYADLRWSTFPLRCLSTAVEGEESGLHAQNSRKKGLLFI